MRARRERAQLLRALVGLRLEPALLGVVLDLRALEESASSTSTSSSTEFFGSVVIADSGLP